jgi:hypothetical protein
MIINRIYETQNLLSLQLVSFLVGLRTYQRLSTFLAQVLRLFIARVMAQVFSPWPLSIKVLVLS